MIPRRIYRLLILSAVAGLASRAMGQVTPFIFSYEGNALPQSALTSPQWTKALDSDPSGPNTSESTASGILTVYTASKSDYLEYQLPGGSGWNPNGSGSTLEVRLRTDFNTAGSNYAGNLVIGTGNKAWVLGIGENYITDLAGGGTIPLVTNDAFHTLRFTITDEVNGSLAMYVDGANTPKAFWRGASSTANRLSFGDTTSVYEGGQIQWDYLRWTNRGKYAPVSTLPKSGEAGFGRQWLRQHPLAVSGECIDVTPGGYQVTPFSVSKYLGMNMNTVFSFQSTVVTTAAANAGVDWHMAANVPPGQYLTADNKAAINAMIAKGHATAWFLPDEPTNAQQLAASADYARWLNANHPELLVYQNVFQNDVNFLNNVVDTIKPDLLMFDNYPFRTGNYTDTNGWFSMLMNVRQVSQTKQIPYGGWLQSFHVSGWDVRTPSESDTRFNGYTLLTAGYSMLNYYVYDNGPATSVISPLLDSNGNPTAMYYYAAAANKEYTTLGKTLRFLKSTDVRFVPGVHTVTGSLTTSNSTPSGLVNWTAGAGSDPFLTNISVSSGQVGAEKNGLVGFFLDDDGQNYFLLTNLNHGETLSAAAASLNFNLTFDNSINEILRLNRVTGVQELIPLMNHQLTWTLPGGTGDLFKYNFGDFIGQGWCMDASGDWNKPDNWGGILPNAIDAKAVLGDVLHASRTIYTDDLVTVGTLKFKSALTYQIAGNGSLTIDVSTGTGLIDASIGSHKINLPLFLKDNTTANVAAGATIKISNPLTLVGNVTLTKTGDGTLSIEAPVYTTAGATVVSAAGVTTSNVDLTANTSVEVSGGIFTLAGTQHVASLRVSGGVTNLNGDRVVTKSMSITGDARIDLGNAKLILDYSGASPLADVLRAIQRDQLTSNSLAAGLTIAAGETSDLFGGFIGTFAGENVDASCVVASLTISGDANLDGVVASQDFNLFASHYGQLTDSRWTQGDFDGDGKVTSTDFNVLSGSFGLAARGVSLGVVVPEPSTGLLLAGAALGWRRRR